MELTPELIADFRERIAGRMHAPNQSEFTPPEMLAVLDRLRQVEGDLGRLSAAYDKLVELHARSLESSDGG